MTALVATGLALLLAAAPATPRPPETSPPPGHPGRTAAEADPDRHGPYGLRGGPWRGRHRTLVDIPVPEGVKVPAWADLSAERQHQLARMKDTWDMLPASRRVHALERLERRRRWDALPPEERERLRQGARNFHDLPPELRDTMRESLRAMRALPDGERRRLFERWRALDPGARRKWLEAGGPGVSPEPGAD